MVLKVSVLVDAPESRRAVVEIPEAASLDDVRRAAETALQLAPNALSGKLYSGPVLAALGCDVVDLSSQPGSATVQALGVRNYSSLIFSGSAELKGKRRNLSQEEEEQAEAEAEAESDRGQQPAKKPKSKYSQLGLKPSNALQRLAGYEAAGPVSAGKAAIALEYVEKRAERILKAASTAELAKIPKPTFTRLLSSERLTLPEVALFDAALRWAQAQAQSQGLEGKADDGKEAKRSQEEEEEEEEDEEKKREPSLTDPHTIKSHRHPVRWNGSLSGHSCDICRQNITQGFRCNSCDFDICRSCFNPEWEAKLKAEAESKARVLTASDVASPGDLSDAARAILLDLLPLIRLPLLSPAELGIRVSPLSLLPHDKMVALFAHAAKAKGGAGTGTEAVAGFNARKRSGVAL